jgi:ribosomal-protein-alanine N-acetyltransferase
LLVSALQASIRKGARLATLEVRAGNQVAQEFYRGFEFEVVNRRPRYYRDNNEDALIMTISGLDRAYAAWLEKKKLTAQDYGNS